MRLLFNKPRLGFKAGQVGEVSNVGVARTLISFGVAVEHVEVKKDEVVSKKNDGESGTSSKRKRSKRSPKRSAE